MTDRPCVATTFWSLGRRWLAVLVVCCILPCLLLPPVIDLNNGRVYVARLPDMECITTGNATMHTARLSGPYANVPARCGGAPTTLEFPSPPKLWNWASGDDVRAWMAEPHGHAFVDTNTTMGYTDPYRLTATWWLMLIVAITALFIDITIVLLHFHSAELEEDDDPPVIKRRTVPNYTTPLAADRDRKSDGVLEIASVGRVD